MESIFIRNKKTIYNKNRLWKLNKIINYKIIKLTIN